MTDKRRTAEEVGQDLARFAREHTHVTTYMVGVAIAKALEDYRNEGIEEAAKVAEETNLATSRFEDDLVKKVTKQIRALKRGGR